jgi:tetratricopeptide (TPR) repeat protein
MTQRVDDGIRASEAMCRLDPTNPYYAERLGFFYFYMGREGDALRHWDKTTRLAPAGAYRAMTEYYLSKGDVEKAKELFSKAERIEPEVHWVKWMRGFMAAQAGDVEAARTAIREIEAKWKGAVNEIAFVYYALGDLDSYFTYIDRATDQHIVRYLYVMYCPLFAKARDDPRYQRFLDKIKAFTSG